MNRLSDEKIILVTRPTRLAELIVRFNTADQARFYVEHLGADFSDYEREDATYRAALAAVREALAGCGRVQIVERAFVPNFIFGPQDFIVTDSSRCRASRLRPIFDARKRLGRMFRPPLDP